MKKRFNADGSVTVQAWRGQKEGCQNVLVYTQEKALDMMGHGWDIDAVAITRRDGCDPVFEYGVLI